MRIVRCAAVLLLVAGSCVLGVAQIQLATPPSYVFGTYLGGSWDDSITSIAIGSDGSIYLLGSTHSKDFPVTPNAFQKPDASGYEKVFITKLSADGKRIIYSTVLQTNYGVWPGGIAVNKAGEVYVSGGTDDGLGDFPTTPGAYQTTAARSHVPAFIIKLDSSGSRLLSSTLLGGQQAYVGDNARAIGLDKNGNVYVVGTTGSRDFPVTPDAIQPTLRSGSNVFVAKLDGTLSHLLFSTYLGGSGYGSYDNCWAASVTPDGKVYIVGTTLSYTFPVTPTAFQSQRTSRSDTGFVSVIDTTQSKLIYSSYLGGSYTDEIYATTVATDGTFFVTGQAQSPDFPVTAGAFQNAFGSGYNLLYNDAFVTRFDPNGSGASSVLYSTFLGQGGFGQAVAADPAGDAFVTGAGGNGFTTPDAFQPNPKDAYIAVLNPSGSSLLYGTYFGASSIGGGSSVSRAITLDSAGNIYYGGNTYMPDFPVTPGVVQPACGDHQNCTSGFSDGTLGKFATQYADLQIGMAVDSGSININEPFSWHITVINKGPSVATNVIVADSLPSTIQQMSAQPSQGTCSGSVPLTCNLGTLGVGQSATVNLSATPLATGLVSNAAAISAATYDPDESNSVASTQMNVLGPADFSISATPQTRTIGAGGIAIFQITSSPQNGFKQTVNLVCSGLPTGAKCQFSPASLNPAVGFASSTLSISFPSSSAELTQSPGYPYAAAIFFLPLLGVFRKKSLLSVLSLLIVFVGCGGSLRTQNTQVVDAVQSHQVVVIATSGTLQHSMNLTVVAQQ